MEVEREERQCVSSVCVREGGRIERRKEKEEGRGRRGGIGERRWMEGTLKGNGEGRKKDCSSCGQNEVKKI